MLDGGLHRQLDDVLAGRQFDELLVKANLCFPWNPAARVYPDDLEGIALLIAFCRVAAYEPCICLP
jgi:hypothetical protein